MRVAGPVEDQARIRVLLKDLNDQQRDAVTRPRGPLAIIAGAGTGKTDVLTRRIAFLVTAGLVSPTEVLAITFTRRAARVMTSRLQSLCGPEAAEIQVGTFHAICASILRRYARHIDRSTAFSIYDGNDKRTIIKRAMRGINSDLLSPREVMREISLAKNHTISLEDYEACAEDEASTLLARLWREYEQTLARADALDFDDLLYRTVTLLHDQRRVRAACQRKWQSVHVDEHQDTNDVQARLLKLLLSEQGQRDLTVVGDESQTIFGFRLADAQLLLDFPEEYEGAETVTLERNYRSSPPILQGANRLISHNLSGSGKQLFPDDPGREGEQILEWVFATDAQEARSIAAEIKAAIAAGADPGEIAVLARNGGVVDRVEQALAAAGVPYQRLGGRGFFERDEVQVALAHLRLLVNPHDHAAFMTALSIRPDVEEQTAAKLLAYADRHGLAPLSAASNVDQLTSIDAAAKTSVAQFAAGMLALADSVCTLSLGEIVEKVIAMPHGPIEALQSGEHEEMRIARLYALRDAARLYEHQRDEVTLQEWLQDAAIADIEEPADLAADRKLVGLGTLHVIKGLEWNTVIAAGCEDGVMPSSYALTDRLMEEERRMAFVLWTRAKRTLVLSRARHRNGRHATPSRFIAETLGPATGERDTLAA
jgi:DNA helicase-2/ATP-dependent DNA helicase PcrA